VHGGLEGSIVINALAGQPINVGIGYTSVGATPMQFDYHVKAVYIGGIPS
jgi:phosphoribosylaminoimidazole carboxylase (NCAIR synthetase)